MMSDIAIRAESLGKMYRIGARRAPYGRFTETLMRALVAPMRHLRDLGKPVPAEELIWALQDVSFEIKRGEAVGIIGRNGAGKSTLLKVLSRITEPTTGRVELHGRVGSLLEVGTGFHPELTGRENIYLNGAILGMKRAEIQSRFDEIVAFAEIERFLDTPVKHYSSGMYVRLAFAVAAHLEPEILLVDEVLAVGDVAFQKKCLGKMENVAREGRTVLFVSHNMAAVRQLCQHGFLIHEGHVLKQGTSDEVIRQYIGSVTASSASVEITLADHVTGLNGIRVHRARLVNGMGDSFAVSWKQAIHLVIEMEVTRPFRDVSLGLGISTLEGVPVFTVHDTDHGEDPVSLSPGFHQVRVRVDNPLRMGTYNLIIGAHEAVAKSSIFYIPNAIRLEVVSSTDTKELYLEHNSGIVNGSSDWVVSTMPEVGLCAWQSSPSKRYSA